MARVPTQQRASSLQDQPSSPSQNSNVCEAYCLVDEKWETGESTLSFCVVGASGDLAKKKILPALFALYKEGMMPKQFSVFGYGC